MNTWEFPNDELLHGTNTELFVVYDCGDYRCIDVTQNDKNVHLHMTPDGAKALGEQLLGEVPLPFAPEPFQYKTGDRVTFEGIVYEFKPEGKSWCDGNPISHEHCWQRVR